MSMSVMHPRFVKLMTRRRMYHLFRHGLFIVIAFLFWRQQTNRSLFLLFGEGVLHREMGRDDAQKQRTWKETQQLNQTSNLSDDAKERVK